MTTIVFQLNSSIFLEFCMYNLLHTFAIILWFYEISNIYVMVQYVSLTFLTHENTKSHNKVLVVNLQCKCKCSRKSCQMICTKHCMIVCTSSLYLLSFYCSCCTASHCLPKIKLLISLAEDISWHFLQRLKRIKEKENTSEVEVQQIEETSQESQDEEIEVTTSTSKR